MFVTVINWETSSCYNPVASTSNTDLKKFMVENICIFLWLKCMNPQSNSVGVYTQSFAMTKYC